MTVEIAITRWTYDYNGQTYCFCAPGCKRTFSKDPEKYLAKA
jgi:P-type Cu+ transporter